jgi:hypothetical protein
VVTKSGDQERANKTFADLLKRALESTKDTVTNLNEALAPKNGSPDGVLPSPEGPSPSCPDEGKSA